VREKLASGYGGSLTYEQIDVCNATDVNAVISRIADQHSRLDGCIAAAGIQKVTPALEYPPEAINEMLDVNYKGVYITATACARQMLKYHIPGSIMLIASMSGLIANKGFTSSVYNSSKAAVIQLSRSLAMEWGRIVDGKPIRVNALCPGNILTPMVKKNFEDDPGLREIWEKGNMLGRMSDPREYRGAALFLLSDASSFMTGSSLIVDGGYTAW
jgi:NAD(P)-dependent dehydrogenase (short-subunit alcohol dehydrogenase family)